MLHTDILCCNVTAATHAVLFKINKERYYDIISNYYALARAIIPKLNDAVEIVTHSNKILF
jgi:glycerol kinase